MRITYPKRDTWLGSTNAEVTKRLALTHDLITEKIEQKTVDDYFPQFGHNRTLIKIDTEGNELSVLRGATRTLQETKPRIIFECWGDSDRTELFDFFNSKNYIVIYLPWSPTNKAQPLSHHQFMISTLHNFIAVPKV
ncbi:conserved hypothetical protein [Candidatus Methylobacter favarea]|uniref:Methyltransferase FkbM domain-containing protein n=1 Tax=Candidatus Methylobacter favarea TaxID=2707345 RepID=A0A8S0XEH9_9GAMM|nr:FkbM family methyltransferase [Candidatus Methylobacter favarea]CAA9889732.1 conserved hypothetical protein [Candidatus Methylobacter favarea]